MKIRTGFVSNSSTSSFLIYGTSLSLDEITRRLNIIDTYVSTYIVRNMIREKLGDDYVVAAPWDDIYIGRSWSSIGDDETGAQFKQRIEKELTDLLGPNLDLYTCEEAWQQ